MKPGRRRLLDKDGAEAAAEKRKAAVRAASVPIPEAAALAKATHPLLLGFSNLLIGRYATG